MKYNTLIIEKKEYLMLKRLLNLSGYTNEHLLGKSINTLLSELEVAEIVDEDKIPRDVVRFNSTLTVTSPQGWVKSFTLVLPNKSNVKEDKISILTPMGAAVIGYAEGDQISWEFPSGIQRFVINKVVQSATPVTMNMPL